MLHLHHHCPCELAGLGVRHCSLFVHTGSQPPHWRRLRGFLRGRDSRYEAHTTASAHCPTATVSGADPPHDRSTQLFLSLILTHSSIACPHPCAGLLPLNPYPGAELEGVDFLSQHQDPNIDFASFHAYPDHWHQGCRNAIAPRSATSLAGSSADALAGIPTT